MWIVMLRYLSLVLTGWNYQMRQWDYDTLYAPIVILLLCISILKLAFLLGWFCVHVEVTATFLIEDVGKTFFFIHFPSNIYNCSPTGTIYQLQKTLYGMNQAPLICYGKFVEIWTGWSVSPIIRACDRWCSHVCNMLWDQRLQLWFPTGNKNF